MKYKEFIKYPFAALAINNVDYDSYVLFKYWCSTTKKSGFIGRGELQATSKNTGIHINKLYRLLSKFKSLGWAVKNGNGYRLLSINTINNNLNLKPKEHRQEGFVFHPFFKVHKNNLEHLNEIKIHSLILQTAKRYNYHQPKANKSNAESLNGKTANGKGFAVSLAKLKSKGNYEYNSQVDDIITNTEKLGLIIRNKNGYNEQTRKFRCNDYVLSNYRWYEPLSVIPITKSVKNIRTRTTVIKKTVWTEAELKFKKFVQDYLPELIQKKYIDHAYYTRTLSKRSYPKVLKRILTRKGDDLRFFLFSYLKTTDIRIDQKLIEANWWTMNQVNRLPKEFSDREYGIEHRFYLDQSETTSEQLNSVLDKIRVAKVNYENGDTVKADQKQIEQMVANICI